MLIKIQHIEKQCIVEGCSPAPSCVPLCALLLPPGGLVKCVELPLGRRAQSCSMRNCALEFSYAQ